MNVAPRKRTTSGRRAAAVLMAACPIFLVAPGGSATDLDRGFRLSAVCASCHRLDALKRVPSIAGLGGENLAGMMQAYASGKRPGNIMHAVARSLSADDITALARYLAAKPNEIGQR